MRKFYIENQNRSRICLNAEEGIMFVSMSGLGVQFDSEYSDSFGGFFIGSKYEQAQGSISGTALFLENPYKLYREFASFIHSATELYFVYAPDENEFYRTVKLSSFDKPEINKTGTISASISFECLSPWYRRYPVTFKWAASPDSEFFMFNVSKFGNDSVLAELLLDSWTKDIYAAEQMDAALKLEITGFVLDPIVKLVGSETGTVYGQVTIGTRIEKGEKFTICSDFLNSYIVKTDANGVSTDYIPNLDLTENFFIRIPKNENCVLSIDYKKSVGMNIYGEIYYYYRSV